MLYVLFFWGGGEFFFFFACACLLFGFRHALHAYLFFGFVLTLVFFYYLMFLLRFHSYLFVIFLTSFIPRYSALPILPPSAPPSVSLILLLVRHLLHASPPCVFSLPLPPLFSPLPPPPAHSTPDMPKLKGRRLSKSFNYTDYNRFYFATGDYLVAF